MKNYVYYHKADLDGHCSGEIVRRCLKSNNLDCELIGINYGEPFDMDKFTKLDTVYFVDWTLQPQKLNFDLASKTNLVIIDHHKTSLGLIESPIIGNVDTSLAACELVWKWFNPNCKTPKFITLLGTYDSWRKGDNWETEVLPFQWGMRSYNTFPGEEIWDHLFEIDHLCFDITEEGHNILSYQKKMNEIIMHNSFSFDFEGYKVLAIIGGGGNSQTFESIWDNTKYDIMMSICNRKNELWSISMYTDKPGLDISTVAKKHGGGGHAQACGFQVQDIYEIIPKTGVEKNGSIWTMPEEELCKVMDDLKPEERLEISILLKETSLFKLKAQMFPNENWLNRAEKCEGLARMLINEFLIKKSKVVA